MNIRLTSEDINCILHYLRDKVNKKVHSDKYQPNKHLTSNGGAYKKEDTNDSMMYPLQLVDGSGMMSQSIFGSEKMLLSDNNLKAAKAKALKEPKVPKESAKKTGKTGRGASKVDGASYTNDDFLDVLHASYEMTPAVDRSKSYTQHHSASSADSSSSANMLLFAAGELDKPVLLPKQAKKRRGKMLDESEINPVLKISASSVGVSKKALAAATAAGKNRSVNNSLDEDDADFAVSLVSDNKAGKGRKRAEGGLSAASAITPSNNHSGSSSSGAAGAYQNQAGLMRKPPKGKKTASANFSVFQSGLTPGFEDVHLNQSLSPDNLQFCSPFPMGFTPGANGRYTDGKTPSSK